MDRRVSNVCPESWGAILGRWPSPLPQTSCSAPSPSTAPGSRPRRDHLARHGLDRLRLDVKARACRSSPDPAASRRACGWSPPCATSALAVAVWAVKERRARRLDQDRRHLPPAPRRPPRPSAPPTSSSGRSSRPARASSPRSSSPSSRSAATRCRPSRGTSSSGSSRRSSAARSPPSSPASSARRWRRRRSPRCTGPTLLDGTDGRREGAAARRSASRVHQDLRVMAWLAPFLVGRIPVAALANPPALVELFAETITEELDFRLEAENMLDVARTFADLDQRGYVIPRPHPTLVTRRMLVMERLEGFRFEDVAGMKDAGVDTEGVVRTGMIGFMEGAMIHGHLPRRPPRREPLRPARRPHGAARLRHHRPAARARSGSRSWRCWSARRTTTSTCQLAALRDLGALPPDVDLKQLDRRARPRPPGGRPHDDEPATSWSPRSSAPSRRCSATGPGCRRSSCSS